ncbi:MAG: sugar ABC transporter substrate-binding protein [Verrucomicrobiota bacterium]
MKTLHPFLAAGAAAVFLLSSCTEPEPPAEATSESEDRKLEVALIMKSLANEFFKTMAEGAEAFQQANPEQFELIVNGIKNETDVAQQVALVEQMIARGVDSIVIAPADSKALISVLKRAQAAGITVVNIDNKLDDEVLSQAGLNIPFVGPDNREGARTVGEELARHLESDAKVAILEGVPTTFNAQQRRAGFEDAMNAAGAEIVTVQSASWEMAKANTVSAAILTANADLAAILASNDSMALGAAAAVKVAGREGQVKIIGFDNITAVQDMIRDGRILATADQHGDKLAVFGIEVALEILSGNGQPEDRKTPVDLVTKETL